MSVNTKSGVVELVSRVRCYLASFNVNAEVHLGWQARHRILNQGPGGANRIIFTPGDDGGNGGQFVATQQPGPRYVGGASQATSTDAIRALYDWERFVVVSVWGRDPTAGGDEESQEASHYEVTEDLIEWVGRALHASAQANIVLGSVTWTPPPERAYGLEARIGLTFRHPIFDVAHDVVRPKPAIAKHLFP